MAIVPYDLHAHRSPRPPPKIISDESSPEGVKAKVSYMQVNLSSLHIDEPANKVAGCSIRQEKLNRSLVLIQWRDFFLFYIFTTKWLNQLR